MKITISRNASNPECAEELLKWWLEDIFKAVKNIHTTSLNDADRLARFEQMEKSFGIPSKKLY
jgi:hypothetical protein